MALRFTKMHGIGNDYVYVETFHQPAPLDPVKLAIAVSDRHFGVGSDGLILIEPSERADARMRMFNNDGSEAEMCGNGIRCVAKFIHDREIARKARVTVETGRGILTLDLEVTNDKAERVRVDMGTPILQASDIPTTLTGDPPIEVPISVGGQTLKVTAVSVGNPHAVIFVEDVANFPVESLGPAGRARSQLPSQGERPLRRGAGAVVRSGCEPGSVGQELPWHAEPEPARSPWRVS